MIKINLANLKTAAFVAEGEAATKGLSFGAGSLKGLKFNADFFKEVPTIKIVFSVVFVFLAGMIYDDQTKQKIDAADLELKQLTQKETALTAEVAKTRGFEKIKQELDKDEFTLKTKIQALKELLESRTVTPQLFVTLSRSIPKEAWLKNFGLADGKIELGGYAVDYDFVSELMQKLGENVLFGALELTKTSQNKDAQGDTVTEFTITGQQQAFKSKAGP